MDSHLGVSRLRGGHRRDGWERVQLLLQAGGTDASELAACVRERLLDHVELDMRWKGGEIGEMESEKKKQEANMNHGNRTTMRRCSALTSKAQSVGCGSFSLGSHFSPGP
jgi:hypothetical protein